MAGRSVAVNGLERGMNRQPPLGLDFIGGRRRGSRIGWVLLLAGAVLIGMAVLDWWAANGQAAHWGAQARNWQDKAKRLEGRGIGVAVDSAAFRQQVQATGKAISRLATPWGELYSTLESSIDESVSLLAISPNAEKGELRLNGEAKDFAALRSYLQRLSDSGTLTDVRLLRQEVKQSDAQRPILFSIVATWRKAS